MGRLFDVPATWRERASNVSDQSKALPGGHNLPEGAPKEAPFDLIFINGAVEANLEALLAQLKDGGRLVAIEPGPGDPTGRAGKAVCYEKIDGGTGYRVLFDASAPVLEAFRKVEQFIFF